ncbi:MAG: hypothetical protein ACOVQT_02835 [Rubrivivax sp.]
MPRPLQALRTLVRQQGPGPAALYVLHRVLGRLSGGRLRIVPYRLVAQPVGQGVDVRDDPASIVRVVTAQDPITQAFPRPAAVNAARWAAGAQCHALTVKGSFAGTVWTQRHAYDEDEVRCRFVMTEPAVSVWDFDVYVEPRLRLGRAMARLWKAVDADMAAQGVRWSFSRISMFNPESLNSHARLGARPVGWAVFFCAGPAQLALLPRAPWVHVSARRGGPVLALRPPAG